MKLKYFTENDRVHFVVVYRYKTLKRTSKQRNKFELCQVVAVPTFLCEGETLVKDNKIVVNFRQWELIFFLEESKYVLSSCI